MCLTSDRFLFGAILHSVHRYFIHYKQRMNRYGEHQEIFVYSIYFILHYFEMPADLEESQHPITFSE